MINWISLLMVIAYSIYFSTSRTVREHISKSSLAKCIPMLLSMTSSVTIGLIIAIWIPHLLAISTIFSIMLSAIIAFLIGRVFGISGIIDAQSSSFMGAMMGAMLGVMLSTSEVVTMVIAADIIYLISLLAIMLLVTKVEKQKKLNSKIVIYYTVFILSITFISTIGVLQSVTKEQVEIQPTVHKHSH